VAVTLNRSPRLTVPALAASVQDGTGGGGHGLRLPIEKYATNPLLPFDSNVWLTVSNSGFWMKNGGTN
jgi:hypothetical protein